MDYGLIGENLSGSFSPQIHKALWGADYILLEKRTEEVGPFLENGCFRGINVATPYQKTVIPFLSELSETARSTGSVNTILRRIDGSLWGHNTDYDGFRMLIHSLSFRLQDRKVLILGDGGLANTVRAVLQDEHVGKLVTISEQNPYSFENAYGHPDAALIVNTTALGMYPNVDDTPVDLSVFPDCKAV
ncbi:MAG: shikimate kinase, partial [Clostridia bacterium]|nr:shikimate kinase [Clostridia bacterium]